MPKVSPTMTAGRLVDWKKGEGEAFEEGEDIADVESDKAVMPISAREDGYMARILVPPDTADIPLGQLLAITVEEEEHIAAFKDYTPSSPDGSLASAPNAKDDPSESKTESSESKEYTGPLGPAVMRLLKMHPNIDVNAIKGSGPKGRILKGDVLAWIEDGSGLSGDANVASGRVTSTEERRTDEGIGEQTRKRYTDIAVTGMRRSIAKRLVASKVGVPHQYTSGRFRLDEILALRKRVNDRAGGGKISVNDFVIAAVGVALRRVPEMNVRWDERSGMTVMNDRIDVSMAVAVPGGLMTPIVKDVDRRGLREIAQVTKDLGTRAREGRLEAEEFEGGCFCVSNLGMYGMSSFSAIINPPQSGILAVGSGSKFWRFDGVGLQMRMRTRTMMTLTCFRFLFLCVVCITQSSVR